MSSNVIQGKSPVRLTATLVGAVFLLVGILGFVPGITSGDMEAAGHHSHAMLLGIFQVSVLHNVVHLLFGVAGLILGRSVAGARNFLVWGGVIYLVLFVYGLFFGEESAGNFVPVNMADNILHFALGAAMLALGLILGRTPALRRA